MLRRIFFAIVVLSSFSVSANDYVRITKENEKSVSLETSITTYVSSEDETLMVDLISVIHVGEYKYYNSFGKHFDKCDTVLYELVGPKGSKPNLKNSNKPNMAKFAQDAIKDLLNLEHQLEIVDYDRENFVHADLSMAEIKQLLKERGETALTLSLGIARDIMRNSNKQQKLISPPDIDLFELIFNQNAREAMKLKRFMASQLVEQLDSDSPTGLETLEKFIIEDRNKKVLTILKKQVKMGDRRVGIFYGAGHMEDFDKRLRSMGFKRKNTIWLKAWNLR